LLYTNYFLTLSLTIPPHFTGGKKGFLPHVCVSLASVLGCMQAGGGASVATYLMYRIFRFLSPHLLSFCCKNKMGCTGGEQVLTCRMLSCRTVFISWGGKIMFFCFLSGDMPGVLPEFLFSGFFLPPFPPLPFVLLRPIYFLRVWRITIKSAALFHPTRARKQAFFSFFPFFFFGGGGAAGAGRGGGCPIFSHSRLLPVFGFGQLNPHMCFLIFETHFAPSSPLAPH